MGKIKSSRDVGCDLVQACFCDSPQSWLVDQIQGSEIEINCQSFVASTPQFFVKTGSFVKSKKESKLYVDSLFLTIFLHYQWFIM